ncbi:helix-turn-helix domain-containing protein [Bathymodiolus platifrons methanotrophic gill symbiont]|uniref:helix-turn-helix domain-containing protein n=1 Tax=Bathymodiolus platifrons methanotrophic gill symbiont TaxID=113268 RepID=UPI001C8E4A50|nr:helix-turn-helix domain-containing protein [Bathymodiolus platifrons methanotrophic gill symbiont]
MSYTHLCPEERYYIEIELKKGTSQNKIAEALERSQSNISREIKRNTGQRGYRHKQAEDFAQERHKNKPKEVKLTDEIKGIVNVRIEDDWSPEQIAGRLKQVGAPCYLTKFRDSCRRDSFTYAANRRCSSHPASATD